MFFHKNKKPKSVQYWTTFLITFIIILIAKIILIFYPIRLDSSDQTYLYYLWSDLPIFFLLLLTIIINTLLKNNKQRIFLNIISLIIIAHYYIDTILIVYFQSRALIPEMFEYISPWATSSFIWYWILLLISLILILIVSSLISKKLKFKKNDIIYIIVLFIIYLWINIVYWNKIKFMGNVLTLNPIYRIANWWYYQPECKTTYIDNLDYVKWKGGKLNIILLVLESYSAIDSENAWWFNNMQSFDSIQNDWIIFKNVIENWISSSAAHESLLYWVINWRKSDYKSFNYKMTPLPEYLNNLWYNTILISTSDLYFMNQKDFFEKAWFQKLIWSEAFEDKDHYTFSAAPDEYLYEKALEELNNQNWNFFMFLKNISFHKPYNTPYWETQELALKYSEDSLYDFYTKLKKTKFFNNWILILIWDHRMMNPAQPGEIQKMWDSRSLRTVATVIGSWIKSWEINNNIIQHTDIYNSIKDMIWSWNVQIDKYYNNIFANESNRDWSITVKWWSTASKNRYDIYSINSWLISLETDELKNLDNKIYEYICSSLALHDEKLENILKIHR